MRLSEVPTASSSGAAPAMPEPTTAHRAATSWYAVLPVSLLTLVVVFLALFLAFAITTPYFLTPENLLNVARQMAPDLVVGVAMTLVITTGGIDLSVGSLLALSGSVAALLMQAGWGWGWASLVVILLGLAAGLFHGYIIGVQKIPPFIVTLATLSAFEGIALYLTNGYSIPVASATFNAFGQGSWLGLPIPAVVSVVAVLIGALALNRTRIGLHITGIGANEESVRRAGVNVVATKVWVYVASSIATVVAGLIVVARLATGSADVGSTFELDVIAAVVLGGTNLFGGEGTMLGTFLGTLIIAMVSNALILLHVQPALTQVAEGVIILAAIIGNEKIVAWQRRRRMV